MDEVALLWLDRLRRTELDLILALANGLEGKVLEIGGGTGTQAAELQRRGVDITSIEMPSSNYKAARVFPLIEYDGRRIPFEDNTFDTLFSSNVLEHVPHLELFQVEMMRVLKPNGRAIHVMPSVSWRLWSLLTHYVSLLQKAVPASFRTSSAPASPASTSTARAAPSIRLKRALFQERHGERGNVLTEAFYFQSSWWRRRFQEGGWIVEGVSAVPLFYTGYMVLKDHLDLPTRERLARILGAASTCYILRKPCRTGG
jgi:SAM-dependent methyltransferase